MLIIMLYDAQGGSGVNMQNTGISRSQLIYINTVNIMDQKNTIILEQGETMPN